MTENSGNAQRPSMRRADALVIGCYLVSLGAAVLVARILAGNHPITAALVADVAATTVVFAFSVVLNNSSMYDPYWSLAPLPIAVYWSLGFAPDGMEDGPVLSPRALVALALLTVWGLRLTWNWRRGWTGLDHEDWRYERFRETTGGLYWLVSATGIHMFPTLIVFAGMVPVFFAATSSRPLGPLDAAGVLVGAVGIYFEWVADNQLRAFRLSGKRGETLNTGLWAYSRHPNYFGEISFWWGLALLGYAGAPSLWWLGAGALAITLMFVFISVPMIDKRMAARRPSFAEHMKRTSAIFPLPRRNKP